MTSIVKAIRTTEDEWGSYAARASEEGLSVNTWVRRALNDTVQLERMIDAQAVLEGLPQPAFTQRRERGR